jgi:hypothetical protein
MLMFGSLGTTFLHPTTSAGTASLASAGASTA